MALGQAVREQADRKAVTITLMREFIASIAQQAEAFERSGLNSTDAAAAQLISLQASCGFWQRRMGECVKAWEVEDFERQRAATYDW
jgi:hypothetical protein